MNQNESLLDMGTYRKALTDFKTGLDRIYAEHTGFIRARVGLSEKRDALLKEYRGGTDNLFSSIFKFRLENFHSGLLRMILDPASPETGDIRYVNQFLECLRTIKPALQDHSFTGRVQVECEAGKKREDGRIDIFIHDAKYGIIIENKINGAPDQPNQLAKYLKFAKEMEKEIIAVVYIPPPYKNSEPPLEGYDKSFREYVPEIREKLVILPVVNTHDKKDLVHGFLEACLELPGNNERQNYILSQYAKLLISIKGAEAMTKDVDMALLAECYKDKESISIMENLGEVWKDREYLLGRLLRDTVRERLVKELGYEAAKDSELDLRLYKQINDSINLCFFSHAENYFFEIGFKLKSRIKGSLREQLFECLNTAAPDAYFEPDDSWGDDWIVKFFRIGDYKKPLTNIADYLINVRVSDTKFVCIRQKWK
jgi:hypothetical protein